MLSVIMRKWLESCKHNTYEPPCLGSFSIIEILRVLFKA